MSENDSPRAHAEDAPPGEPAGDGDAATIRAELTDLQDRHLRLAADFDNFRRRKSQELADRGRYSSEEAIRALLPVLDNLVRAVDQAPAGVDPGFLDGIGMVVRQFEDALAGLGVTRVPGAGAPFDPALHEAVTGEESADVDRETVVDVLQNGYLLHDRLIRPALVRVAHPAPEPSPPAPPRGSKRSGGAVRSDS